VSSGLLFSGQAMHQHRSIQSECDIQDHNVVLMPRVPEPSHHRSDLLSNYLYTCCDAKFTFPAGPVLGGNLEVSCGARPLPAKLVRQPLYSPEERRRRDATRWTLVQGILAPVQFLAFAVSLALVLRYLASGEGLWIATCSVVIKTLLLYTIMITGSIWERVVFGRYLFARAFFWEDVFSILVLALHTTYIVAIIGDIGSPQQQMALVLAAYASYAINATQFLLKLRAARSPAHVVVGGTK
jgi:3-vinyl bacteriochlorophyllide hydratase